jgi:hypothetical protein
MERSGTMTLAHSRQLRENVRAYGKIMSQLASWIESDGRRYGIRESR